MLQEQGFMELENLKKLKTSKLLALERVVRAGIERPDSAPTRETFFLYRTIKQELQSRKAPKLNKVLSRVKLLIEGKQGVAPQSRNKAS
jgi:hypothetical protein